MCQNSAYIKLWLYDEIISGQMPLWKVPKDIYFFQFFSLIQHIYCSIDNTYSSKICIHIKPRTSNLFTCVLLYYSQLESQCNGIFNQSKSISPIKISELFVIIDRSKNPTIFNIICWLAESLGWMTHRPSVWCSSTKRLMFQVLFFFLNFLQNSLQKSFQFFFF